MAVLADLHFSRVVKYHALSHAKRAEIEQKSTSKKKRADKRRKKNQKQVMFGDDLEAAKDANPVIMPEGESPDSKRQLSEGQQRIKKKQRKPEQQKTSDTPYNIKIKKLPDGLEVPSHWVKDLNQMAKEEKSDDFSRRTQIKNKKKRQDNQIDSFNDGF